MPVYRDSRNGKWFYKTTVKLPDGTGERIQGTPGVPGPWHALPNSRVGAQEAERRAIVEVMNPRPKVEPQKEAAPKKTIREHAVTFLELYLPEQKPSARRTKEYVLDGHVLPFFGEMTIDELTQQTIDAFTAKELKRGMKPRTISERLAVLSTLIKYVTGERSRLRFHVRGMSAQIHAVPMGDVEKLLEACTDDRYRVAILLAAEAGLRCGEIRGLQWTDIKDGQLTVRRALDYATCDVIAPKHNKQRTIPLSPRLASAFASLPKRGLWIVSRLDGGPLGYFAIVEAMRAVYADAGVPKPPKLLHCLRHTFGTEMARRVALGVLQQLMGHAEVTTTMRYVDVSEADKRDAIALVFGPGVRDVSADSGD